MGLLKMCGAPRTGRGAAIGCIILAARPPARSVSEGTRMPSLRGLRTRTVAPAATLSGGGTRRRGPDAANGHTSGSISAAVKIPILWTGPSLFIPIFAGLSLYRSPISGRKSLSSSPCPPLSVSRLGAVTPAITKQARPSGDSLASKTSPLSRSVLFRAQLQSSSASRLRSKSGCMAPDRFESHRQQTSPGRRSGDRARLSRSRRTRNSAETTRNRSGRNCSTRFRLSSGQHGGK
jgi:hypothetical protein